MSFINNPVVYLFDDIEANSGITLANFMVNETKDPSNYHAQPYMQQYQNNNITNNKPQLYKYIYDPNLNFDWRLHQRISQIQYTSRQNNWVSIIFNTGQVRPLTNVLSHQYAGQTKLDYGFYNIKTRKLSVPINLVFISNNISYLYTFLENISFYWDRFVNFHYKQAIQYSPDYTENYNQTGQAANIVPVNLEKLDTQRRGTLVTAAYTFDLVYFDHSYTDTTLGPLLKTIDLRVFTLKDISNFNMCVQ